MTIEHPTPSARVALTLAAVLVLVLPGAVSGQSHQPPSEPPADWGPISINLEEFEYPHPVEFMNFQVYGQDVRIAYMDVAPVGPANGRAVVFIMGAATTAGTGRARSRPSPTRATGLSQRTGSAGEVVQADPPVQHEPPRLQHGPAHGAPRHRRGRHRRTLDRRADGDPVRLPLSEKTTHLVTINQIGLTDGRAGRGFNPFDGEIDADPDLARAYEADVRTDTRRYVEWKPEFLEHLRIRHGQRLSGDWPRLAYVRRLGGNLRSMDTVVNDWPHIQTKTLILGGEIDGPDFPANARRAAEIFPNGEVFLIPNVGHNPHEEVPDIVNAELIRFLGTDPV